MTKNDCIKKKQNSVIGARGHFWFYKGNYEEWKTIIKRNSHPLHKINMNKSEIFTKKKKKKKIILIFEMSLTRSLSNHQTTLLNDSKNLVFRKKLHRNDKKLAFRFFSYILKLESKLYN